MANYRPAGLSDESDDDYEFFDKLNHNYNYFETDSQKNEARLQNALVNGNLEEVMNIINTDLKGNVNSKLASGWTLLFHACFNAQEKMVETLLNEGADPNIHADSVTPVMLACSNNNVSETVAYNIVSNLIQHNCLLNVGDKYGITPLMKAVSSGYSSIIELIIDKGVNIEMRDRQGWTAVFWAIHHNQAKCLDILLSKNARLNILDLSKRSPLSIAQAHNHSEIKEVLSKYIQFEEDEHITASDTLDYLTSWQDYYPGLWDENRPKYTSEIHHLLYGMKCDQLKKKFDEFSIDLRKFLLLDESDMIKMGIELPFEQQRLRQGLRAFHTRKWKVSAVAGLQANKSAFYSIIEYVNVLGVHLQQLYILEATLMYILRNYSILQNQVQCEPPDSAHVERFENAARKMIKTINDVRWEINKMKKIYHNIGTNSLQPVDFVPEESNKGKKVLTVTKLVAVCSLGLLLYHSKGFIRNMLLK